MFDRVLAEVLERHGAALTPACRADLTAALRAAGVAAPEASTDKLQLLDLAGQTWGDADEEPTEAHSLLPQRYEDLGLLGHGGMGQVRRAFDRVLEREVALKMVKARPSPQQQQRFTTEAVQTAALMHPGIVPVFDYGVLDSGVPYYTMPVIGGHTLGAAIEAVHAASTRGAWGLTPEGMSLRRLVSAFHDACEAVAYAHSRGVVHRDLKPDNVMLGEFGETLVLDWGLAEHKDAEGSGGISGTPAYMAPEQAAGEAPSIASDVYGLGAMLYQVLGGEAPYAGMTRREVLDAVRTRSPAPIERTTALALPWDLVLLCRRCMDRDPARRPESAHTVAREVAGWLDGLKRRDEADALVQSAVDLFDEVASPRCSSVARSQRCLGVCGRLADTYLCDVCTYM